MYLLVLSTKHHIHTFQFCMACGEYILPISEVEFDQFCLAPKAPLTVMRLNPVTSVKIVIYLLSLKQKKQKQLI